MNSKTEDRKTVAELVDLTAIKCEQPWQIGNRAGDSVGMAADSVPAEKLLVILAGELTLPPYMIMGDAAAVEIIKIARRGSVPVSVLVNSLAAIF